MDIYEGRAFKSQYLEDLFLFIVLLIIRVANSAVGSDVFMEAAVIRSHLKKR